jgi:hypothetical protein
MILSFITFKCCFLKCLLFVYPGRQQHFKASGRG